MFSMQASANNTSQSFSPRHYRSVSPSVTPDLREANINTQINARSNFSPGDEIGQADIRRVEEDLRSRIQAIKDAYIRDNAMLYPPSPESCPCHLTSSCIHQAERLAHQKKEFMRVDEEYKEATNMIITEALETCAQMLQMERYRREVAFSQSGNSSSDVTAVSSPANTNHSGGLGSMGHQRAMVESEEENDSDSSDSSDSDEDSGYPNHRGPIHQPQTRRQRPSIVVDQSINNSPQNTNNGGGPPGYQADSPLQPHVEVPPPLSSGTSRQHQYGDSIIPLPTSDSPVLPKRSALNSMSRASDAAFLSRSADRSRSSVPTPSESQYASSLLSPPPVRLNMPVPTARVPASSAAPVTFPPRHHWHTASLTTASLASPSVATRTNPSRVVPSSPRTNQLDYEPDDEWKARLWRDILRKAEKMMKQKRASHATFMKGIPNEDDRRVLDWEYEQSKSRPQPKMDMTAWKHYQYHTEVAREREQLVRKHRGSRQEQGEATSETPYKQWVPSSTAV